MKSVATQLLAPCLLLSAMSFAQAAEPIVELTENISLSACIAPKISRVVTGAGWTRIEIEPGRKASIGRCGCKSALLKASLAETRVRGLVMNSRTPSMPVRDTSYRSTGKL